MNILRPVLFLELNGVLCISREYNSAEMLGCYRLNQTVRPTLWAGLVDVKAAANLRVLHTEFNPLYVISSDWATYLDRGQILDVFTRTHLKFVGENLHGAWLTPRTRSTSRASEIEFWLDEFGSECQAFLVIDDVRRECGLMRATFPFNERVLLCDRDAGFTGERLEQARSKLRTQLAGRNNLDNDYEWV